MIEEPADTRQDVSSSGRGARIRLYPGGPLLVRGEVELMGPDGAALRPRRRVVALCRCGRSALFPYCDGNHKSVSSFSAERDLRASRRLPTDGADDPCDGSAAG